MKKLLITLLIIVGVHTVAMNANAKSFEGFKRRPASLVTEVSGPVMEYTETDSQFKILIGLHAAFYNFPKNQYADEMRSLLATYLKSKKPLKLKVDSVTREIISLEDAQ